MNVRPLVLAVATTVLAGNAFATPFAPFDVRAAGMGGTGVASAKAASAALFNPAMLSAEVEGDKFQLVLGGGAQMADESNMFDQTDALTTRFDQLNSALAAANLPQIESNALNAAQQMQDISGDYLFLGAAAGIGVGVPAKKVGVGVTVSGNAYADASPKIGGTDIGALLDLADNGVLDNPAYAGKVSGNTFNADSTAEATGVLVTEIGVALSHLVELGSGGTLAVGITPKAVDVTTYHYEEKIDGFDSGNIDSTTFEKVGNHVDLDAGLVYKPKADSQWQYGLVVRNLADKTYTTVPGTPTGLPVTPARDISLGTQVRAGVARMSKRYTLAADLDLTKNDGIAPGTETQFLAIGAEYDLKYVQARCGYRANLANSNVDDAFSAGLGLGPVDISVIGNSSDVGAYLQLGFGW